MSTTKWVIDPTHSEIGFKVKHLMFTNVSGKFQNFDAAIVAESEGFENAEISFNARIDSVSTGNKERDEHLLNSDFFDVAQYPEITFDATSFVKNNDGEYTLTGDLSLHGVTKRVTLPTEFGGIITDPWGHTKAGFSISSKINRKDWGLTWNAALETGGVIVSDEVRLEIELQFVKQ